MPDACNKYKFGGNSMDAPENRMKLDLVNGRTLLSVTYRNNEVIHYQFEMMSNNNIPRLLKSHFVRIDGEIRLFFDITSLITLEKLFERRGIGRQEFLYIIKQLISLLEGLEEYLLNYNGVVFDKRFIYVNAATLDIYFMYLPSHSGKDGLESIRTFLLDSIVKDIKFRNEQSDNYVQKLLEILKNGDFNLMLLKDYARDMERSVPVSGYASGTRKNPVMPGNTPGIASEGSPAPVEITGKYLAKESKPDAEFTGIKDFPGKSEKTVRLAYPLKSYIILFTAIAVFILFGIVLCISGTLSPGNPDFLLTLFGYFMIGGALAYLIYFRFFTPEKRIKGKEQKSVTGFSGHERKELFMNKSLYIDRNDFLGEREPGRNDEAACSKTTPCNFYYVNKSIGLNLQRPASSNEYAGNHYNDSTVFLGAVDTTKPCLKRAKNSEIVALKRFPFMIGRLPEQVDFCLENPAVGKLHAEITREDENYYITDMNSRNGTMINGERIMPGQCRRILNGDRITFANEEFTFYC